MCIHRYNAKRLEKTLSSAESLYILDDIKKFAILKNGIGIEGQESTQTS